MSAESRVYERQPLPFKSESRVGPAADQKVNGGSCTETGWLYYVSLRSKVEQVLLLIFSPLCPEMPALKEWKDENLFLFVLMSVEEVKEK